MMVSMIGHCSLIRHSKSLCFGSGCLIEWEVRLNWLSEGRKIGYEIGNRYSLASNTDLT